MSTRKGGAPQRLGVALLISVLPHVAAAVGMDNPDPVMREYWRDHGPSLGQLIDGGGRVIQSADSNLIGAVLDGLRISDEAAESAAKAGDAGAALPRVYAIGKVAGAVEGLHVALKVYDSAVKEGQDAAQRTAVVEGSKWLLGNATGGFAAETAIAVGGSVAPAIVVGWAATTGTEVLIDAAAAAIDRQKNLPAGERTRRSAEDVARLQREFGIPDDALVVWKENPQGMRMRETTWSDRSVRRDFTQVTWHDALGHPVASDFGERSEVERKQEAVGDDYRIVARQTFAEAAAGKAPTVLRDLQRESEEWQDALDRDWAARNRATEAGRGTKPIGTSGVGAGSGAVQPASEAMTVPPPLLQPPRPPIYPAAPPRQTTPSPPPVTVPKQTAKPAPAPAQSPVGKTGTCRICGATFTRAHNDGGLCMECAAKEASRRSLEDFMKKRAPR
jgi:hypothetical protein